MLGSGTGERGCGEESATPHASPTALLVPVVVSRHNPTAESAALGGSHPQRLEARRGVADRPGGVVEQGGWTSIGACMEGIHRVMGRPALTSASMVSYRRHPGPTASNGRVQRMAWPRISPPSPISPSKDRGSGRKPRACAVVAEGGECTHRLSTLRDDYGFLPHPIRTCLDAPPRLHHTN